MFSLQINSTVQSDFVSIEIYTTKSVTHGPRRGETEEENDFLTYRKSDVGAVLMLFNEKTSGKSEITIVMKGCDEIHLLVPDSIAVDVYNDLVASIEMGRPESFPSTKKIHKVEV